MSLQQIDFGMTPAQFRERYFERTYLHRRAALRSRLVDWSTLDDWFHRIEPSAPGFQVFDRGAVPEDLFTETYTEFGLPRRRLSKRRFFTLLRSGATLVINRLENHSRPIARLCAEVGRFARAQTVGNAYLSFGGAGTFGRHWDTHDVFALQLFGRKRWRVFAPTMQLPLGMHSSEGRQGECPTLPAFECILEQGDMLYLPRGWWHEAMPLNEPSLHVSVGTYGPTVQDYLIWLCTHALPEEPVARRALTDSVGAEDLAAVVAKLDALVRREAKRAEFEQGFANQANGGVEYNSELFFGSGAQGLTSQALVCLNGFRSPRVDDGELLVGGARLRLNSICLAIVTLLADGSAQCLGALCERLGEHSPATIRLAVLDLALHEIVSISQQ